MRFQTERATRSSPIKPNPRARIPFRSFKAVSFSCDAACKGTFLSSPHSCDITLAYFAFPPDLLVNSFNTWRQKFCFFIKGFPSTGPIVIKRQLLFILPSSSWPSYSLYAPKRHSSMQGVRYCPRIQNRKTASRRSLRDGSAFFAQAAARGFCFLRQPSRPNPASPPTKSGSAEGKGTAARGGSGGSALPSPWLFWFSPLWLF